MPKPLTYAHVYVRVCKGWVGVGVNGNSFDVMYLYFECKHPAVTDERRK